MFKISKNLNTSDGKHNNAIYKNKKPILMKIYVYVTFFVAKIDTAKHGENFLKY